MKSNQLINGFVGTAATLFCLNAMAEVTLPHTFSAGTPAKADEVNANFTALKTGITAIITEINTNITDIETNSDDINTNAVNIGINAAAISDLQTASGNAGTVSLPPQAFKPTRSDGTCHWDTGIGGAQGFFRNTVNPDACNLVASIQIPDGVTINSLSCNVHDLTDQAQWTFARLYQHNLNTGGAKLMFETPGTGVTQEPGRLNINDSSINNGDAINNNAIHAYSIALDSDGLGNYSNPTNLILYSCRVSYQ